ncbi:MAG TPA: hypothetical protein ENL06_01385 [Candidatus Portnoybacteria bacterium]|nr:hypothetical protein [Candidatus Portnoybacteria bacterium]
MSKITKKIFCVCFSIIILLLTETVTIAAVAVWVPESQKIHISDLRVGNMDYWADLAYQPDQLGFVLPDWGNAEEITEQPAQWWGKSQSIYIPDLRVGEVDFWAQLIWHLEKGVFQLADWCQRGLEIFGPAFNAVDGFGDWRKNLEETSCFSNFAMIASDSDGVKEIATHDAEKIKEALSLGMNRTMVVITNVLFTADFNPDGSLKNVRLRPDYKERIQRYSLYLHFYGSRNPWAFYVLDEPYSAAIQIGMSIREMREMLNTAIVAIKKVFPDSKTANGIAITREDLEQENILGFPVPPNAVKEYGFPGFDIIAVYCYWPQYRVFYPGSTLEDSKKVFQEKYLGNAKDNLLSGQKIVIVPGTFEFPGQEISVEDYLDLANFYWCIARSNPKVVGIVPFLWPTTEGLVGLKNLPPEVQRAWEGIGRKIISRGASLR